MNKQNYELAADIVLHDFEKYGMFGFIVQFEQGSDVRKHLSAFCSVADLVGTKIVSNYWQTKKGQKLFTILIQLPAQKYDYRQFGFWAGTLH